MKKKLLALVLTGAMTAGMLAGCGDASSAPAADSTAAAAATSEAAAAETSDAAATTGDAAATSDWASAIKFTASSANSAAPDWSSYDSLINEIYTDTDLTDRVPRCMKLKIC